MIPKEIAVGQVWIEDDMFVWQVTVYDKAAGEVVCEGGVNGLPYTFTVRDIENKFVLAGNIPGLDIPILVAQHWVVPGEGMAVVSRVYCDPVAGDSCILTSCKTGDGVPYAPTQLVDCFGLSPVQPGQTWNHWIFKDTSLAVETYVRGWWEAAFTKDGSRTTLELINNYTLSTKKKQDLSAFPHTCPSCGSKAFEFLCRLIDCSNSKCHHFGTKA